MASPSTDPNDAGLASRSSIDVDGPIIATAAELDETSRERVDVSTLDHPG